MLLILLTSNYLLVFTSFLPLTLNSLSQAIYYFVYLSSFVCRYVHMFVSTIYFSIYQTTYSSKSFYNKHSMNKNLPSRQRRTYKKTSLNLFT